MRKLAIVVLVASPSLALASGYALPNTNPRDLALSASAVAAQSDSGAAFALPASLSRVNGWSARLSAGGVSVMTDWKDPGNSGTGPANATTTASNEKTLTPIGSLSLAYGGKIAAWGDRGWGVGLGVEPFGGSVVQWADDWTGRYRIVKVDREVFSGVLTAGIEVVPRVRLGGGLVYYYTMQKLKSHFYMAPFAGTTPADVGNPATWNPALPDAVVDLDMSGGAVSYDVSAEAQPLPDVPFTIAIDYKHKATQTLDGTVKWQNLTPLAAGIGATGALPFANQDGSQELTIPNTLNIGLAYRVMPPLLLTFTYTFDRWIVYQEDALTAASGYTLTFNRHYTNGWTVRGGAEYDLNKMWTVRGGLQYDHSGLDTKYYSPMLPDATSWALSAGGTVRFSKSLALDAAVFYAMMNEVTSTDPNPATPGTGIEPQATPPATFVPVTEGTFRGTYNTSVLVFGLGLAWTPGAQ